MHFFASVVVVATMSLRGWGGGRNGEFACERFFIIEHQPLMAVYKIEEELVVVIPNVSHPRGGGRR